MVEDAEVLANLEPCGYILSAFNYKYFALQCLQCAEKYGNWSTFIQHCRELHTKVDEQKSAALEDIRDPKITITETTRTTETITEENEDSKDSDCDNMEQYLEMLKNDNNESSSDSLDDDWVAQANNSNAELNTTDDSDEIELRTGSEIELESDDDDLEVDSNSASRKFLINLRTKNKATCDFIECYKQHSCLWNIKDDNYNNAENRTAALKQIIEYFKQNYNILITEKYINVSIRRLHAFYKRSCLAKRKNTETGRFYFERCAFLAGIEFDDKIRIKNISCKKITFGITDQFTLGFIDMCSNFPILWDVNHKDYCVIVERKNAYENMIEQLRQRYAVEFSKEELYDAIDRLKHYYYNVQDKVQRNEPLTPPEVLYLEHCKYFPVCRRKLKCHVCDRVSRNEATLKIHMLNVHNIGELPHKCAFCTQRFAYRRAVKQHEIRAHTQQFELFCKYCRKGFACRNELSLHERVHTGERNCICEHCGKAFRLKNQMTEHVKIVHERVRRFKCTMCPKDYLRKRHLDDHIRAHLNIRDKVCITCGKTFTNLHALFRHKQLHTAEKRYGCKTCGQRFHQLVGLNSHIKRKHKMDNASDKQTSEETAEEEVDEPQAN